MAITSAIFPGLKISIKFGKLPRYPTVAPWPALAKRNTDISKITKAALFVFVIPLSRPHFFAGHPQAAGSTSPRNDGAARLKVAIMAVRSKL
jgi:hypothetical protein